MKNVVDVVLGGVSYWAIGYGLSYGSDTVSSIIIIIKTLISGKNCSAKYIGDMFLGDEYVLWLGFLVC